MERYGVEEFSLIPLPWDRGTDIFFRRGQVEGRPSLFRCITFETKDSPVYTQGTPSCPPPRHDGTREFLIVLQILYAVPPIDHLARNLMPMQTVVTSLTEGAGYM